MALGSVLSPPPTRSYPTPQMGTDLPWLGTCACLGAVKRAAFEDAFASDDLAQPGSRSRGHVDVCSISGAAAGDGSGPALHLRRSRPSCRDAFTALLARANDYFCCDM